MNNSFTIQETAAQPAPPVKAAGADAGGTSAAQQLRLETGGISSAEMAQKVMRLTGSVRLASRSAHHWHHCGINE